MKDMELKPLFSLIEVLPSQQGFQLPRPPLGNQKIYLRNVSPLHGTNSP